MYISRVHIENFRNFENVVVETGRTLLLVGANATGKSNFIYALRLVLDSSLSWRDRMLTADDFWRGNDLAPWQGRKIKTSIDLTDFEDDLMLRSVLDDHNVGQPGTARLTYIYQPKNRIAPETSSENDYEFRIFGGKDDSNEILASLKDALDLRVIEALRDAETELISRRLPLRSLLELYGIDGDALKDVVEHLEKANQHIQSVVAVQTLETEIRKRLQDLKEHIHELEPVLRLSANSSEAVLRSLRILLEEDHLLAINTTSLGLANLLFLALSLLEIEKRESADKNATSNTFNFIVLAIEEPEAHLHPHIQRILFRDFFKRSPLILSTHSPHIASVAPIESILMFRDTPDIGSQISSTARIRNLLNEIEIHDLERYLDITLAELLFARGVILVEGDTEEFTISVLARLVGYDLDKYGISVCNIRGTNFKPYVRLLSSDILNTPYIVLTDGDKYANLTRVAIPNAISQEKLTEDDSNRLKDQSVFEIRTELENISFPYYFGFRRCIELLDVIPNTDDLKAEIENNYAVLEWDCVIEKLEKAGMFVNQWSFEPSLLQCGFSKEIFNALQDCGIGPQVKTRLQAHLSDANLSDLQIDEWLTQIDNIGKGRVGQRFSTKLLEICLPGGREIPPYIHKGLSYLIERLDNSATFGLSGQQTETDNT